MPISDVKAYVKMENVNKRYWIEMIKVGYIVVAVSNQEYLYLAIFANKLKNDAQVLLKRT